MKTDLHASRFMSSLRRREGNAMRAMCSWLVETLKIDLSGDSPSTPGTPPGLESGAGRDAVTFQVVDGNGRVGPAHEEITKFVGKRNKTVNPGIYMIAHDKGTVKNVSQRPWLVSSVAKFRDALVNIYKTHFA